MKIFSKEKFLKDPNTIRFVDTGDSWEDECDGKEVINGICGGYLIHDDWCIEREEKEMKFKVGDIVKINKKISLKDLTKNYWNGCQLATMEFLKKASYEDFEEKYKVRGVRDGCVTVENFGSCVNEAVFVLVERKKVKEMTVEEISKALGYEVKIVK